MAQHFRGLAALLDDLGLKPSTHIRSQPPATAAPGLCMPSASLFGLLHIVVCTLSFSVIMFTATITIKNKTHKYMPCARKRRI